MSETTRYSSAEKAAKLQLACETPLEFVHVHPTGALEFSVALAKQLKKEAKKSASSGETAKHSLIVHLCDDPTELRGRQRDLEYFAGENASKEPLRIAAYTQSTHAPRVGKRVDRGASLERLATLGKLLRSEVDILLISPSALLKRCIPPEILAAEQRCFEIAAEFDFDSLKTTLFEAVYALVPAVEDPGCVAFRGDIVDIWAPGSSAPARIEFFDTMVSRIRSFDPDTQLSEGELSDYWVGPARELFLSPSVKQRAYEALQELCDEHNYPSLKSRSLLAELDNTNFGFHSAQYFPAFYDSASLFDYFPDSCHLVLQSVDKTMLSIETTEQRISLSERHGSPPQYAEYEHFVVIDELRQRLLASRYSALFEHGILGKDEEIAALRAPSSHAIDFGQRAYPELLRSVEAARISKSDILEPVIEQIRRWLNESYEVLLIARSSSQLERLSSLISGRGLKNIEEGKLSIKQGSLAHGFVDDYRRKVFIPEDEIFGIKAPRSKSKKKRLGGLDDLRSLTIGDLIIHAEHGIGRYLGLETRTLPSGKSVDLLLVEYRNHDKLLIPVYRLNQVQKFAGAEAPRELDKLGGQSFQKTKGKAQKRIREMADQLMKLYVERAAQRRDALPPPGIDFENFEAAFPYDETPDQAAAIQDVMDDFERDRVMDRVICGDVGFGKTEVAMRAIFRSILAGKQAALMCPTTVLAQQHYRSFEARLSPFGVEVACMSRFQSKKLQTETLKRMREGKVDLIVGTHRLLSKDVQFKDLGIVVIDEEQRFGVVHKERFKTLRSSIDVLTLTATPIPRTLQLAVGGLRDLSMISTAPIDRHPIRTQIHQSNIETIQLALEKELARGGQAYFVTPKIEGLYERANQIKKLFPETTIAVAHGQMKESELEDAMLDFIEGRASILVSTAIVESGLDISRANTIIIDRADQFGLAQLYQLRGRVGRSHERAYCHLLIPAPAAMTDEARSRVEALERHTELGSGLKIAALDMELRGTGNLLGSEQSGIVESVGLELFCRMLAEATAELSGEEVVHEVDPEISCDVELLLPESYIDEVTVRLSFYKRLASANDIDEVRSIGIELEDRFGAPPQEALHLLSMMGQKPALRDLRVLNVECGTERVVIRFREDTPLRAEKIPAFLGKRRNYSMGADFRLVRKSHPKEVFATGPEHLQLCLSELNELLKG